MKNHVFFSYSFHHRHIVEYYYSFFSKYAPSTKKNLEREIFFYDKVIHKDTWEKAVIDFLRKTKKFVLFLGEEMGNTQRLELEHWNGMKHKIPESKSLLVLIEDPGNFQGEMPSGFDDTVFFKKRGKDLDRDGSFLELYKKLEGDAIPFIDGLPTNSQIFNYEKDIINFYTKKYIIDEKIIEDGASWGDNKELKETLDGIKEKLNMGVPPSWPDVKVNERIEQVRDVDIYEFVDNPLLNKNPDSDKPYKNSEIGDPRDDRVVAAALANYHSSSALFDYDLSENPCEKFCLKERALTFPEAGPREKVYNPINFDQRPNFNVAILVSGGIAPGINALIDSITRRHFKYARKSNYEDKLQVFGMKNGFLSFINGNAKYLLYPDDELIPKKSDDVINTSEFISHGGSIIGTSRDEDLEVAGKKRMNGLSKILTHLESMNVSILYVIGGEGSMKAAHTLYSLYEEDEQRKEREKEGSSPWRFNVVGIPKTMDNDILWVWQTFGFMSAVEKARGVHRLSGS